MSNVAICRFCSGVFETWEQMRDHQKTGKCPKDKPLAYPNRIEMKSEPLPQKPKGELKKWL